MLRTKPFDAARYLTDPETIRLYLADTFKAGDPTVIRHALFNVARAMGATKIARQADMTRKGLQQALTDEHVQYTTIVRILGAMGYTLTVQRAEPPADDIWQIVGARYCKKAGKLRIEFSLGVRYYIPIDRFRPFAALDSKRSAADLKDVEVSKRGRSVRFPRLGVKLGISDIGQAIMGGTS
jgi:probable addiction module antidote protein